MASPNVATRRTRLLVSLFAPALFGLLGYSQSNGLRLAAPPGQTVDFTLNEIEGNTLQVYRWKIAGAITIDAQRRIIALDGTVAALQSLSDQKVLSVAKAEVTNGTVVLTTTEGAVYTVFELFNARIGNIGKIKLTRPADATTAQNAGKQSADKHPSEWTVTDDTTTFARVTTALDSNLPEGKLVVREIERLTEWKAYTGAFNPLDPQMKPATTVLSPKPGVTLVKVIFDLYSGTQPEVLWKDDIILSAGKSQMELVNLMLQSSKVSRWVTVGFNGLTLTSGGNRIAIICGGQIGGDPAQLHLRIRDKDYGSLGNLTGKAR